MHNYPETFPFWKELTDDQKQLLSTHTIERSFQKGDILNHGSQECTGLEMMVKGQARIFTISPQGDEITLYRLLEQDVCVLLAACMIHSSTFTVSMEFETDAVTLLIPKQTLQIVSSQSYRVKDFTMELVADRFSFVMNIMHDVIFSSNEHRLAQVLLIWMQLQEATSLQLTHDMLVHELGATRGVVSRLLKQFQRDDLFQQSRGCITIFDKQRLARLQSCL